MSDIARQLARQLPIPIPTGLGDRRRARRDSAPKFTAPEQLDGPRTMSPSVKWLAWCAGASLILTVAQYGLAVASHSLALLANMGHTFGDFLTFLFIFWMEQQKVKGANAGWSRQSMAFMDAASAFIVVMIIILTQAYACIDAIDRLTYHGHVHSTKEVDFKDLGPAYVGFISVQLLVTVALLVMHKYMVKDPAELAEKEAQQMIQSEQHIKNLELKKSFARANDLKPSLNLKKGDAPPSDDCACCVDEFAEQGLEQENLNMMAAYLHLVADTIANLLILVVGVLIVVGTLKDAEGADAVTALVVSLCVFLGTAVLFRRASRVFSLLIWGGGEDLGAASPGEAILAKQQYQAYGSA